MVTKIELLEVKNISGRPVDHLFIWVMVEGPSIGAQPIKRWSMKQDMDLHPLP